MYDVFFFYYYGINRQDNLKLKITFFREKKKVQLYIFLFK